MIISNLNYLESAVSSSVKGGLFNFASYQKNQSIVLQSSSANAGNFAFISAGNTAVSGNLATVTQANV